MNVCDELLCIGKTLHGIVHRPNRVILQSVPILIAVMGPTASGKSDLAEALADELGVRLLNADAFQVYRGLDIGTNKPREKERYSLLDLKAPDEDFGVGEWVRLAQAELEDLYAQGKNAIVVGGSGYYVRALFEQYDDLHPAPDPEVRAFVSTLIRDQGLEAAISELRRLNPHTTADLRNPVRVSRALERALAPGEPLQIELPPFRKLKLAIDFPAAELNARIEARTETLLQAGWVEEVQGLLSLGVPRNAPGFRAIGYRSIIDLLDRKTTRADVIEGIKGETRRYAKRQRAWLRREPNLYHLDGSLGLGIWKQAATDLIGRAQGNEGNG